METLNQTWRKQDDGFMLLIASEVVAIPDILPEPDLEEMLLRITTRLDALELKTRALP